MAVKIAGVDISVWQNAVNYKQLAAGKINGYKVEFAMLRFSCGKAKDKLIDKHYKGCKAAGLKVGAYHWLVAQTVEAAKAEAQWLVEQMKNYQFDYPIAIDFEDSKLFALNLSKAQYTAIVDAFGEVLKNAGYYVILYTNPDTLRNRLNADITDRYDIWLAHWTDVPAQYGQTMWQWAALGSAAQVKSGNATKIGTVSGANAPCDVDWCYVDYATKIKEGGYNGHKKPTEKTYFIVGTKVCKGTAALTTAKNQLNSLGYDYTIVNN